MKIKNTAKPKKLRKLLAILVAMGFMSFASVNMANADITSEAELNEFIQNGTGESNVTENITLTTSVSNRTRIKTDAITLIGQSAETYISGGSSGTKQQGFYFGKQYQGINTDVTIKTLTIKEMSADVGGAIYNISGTLTISDSTFSNNSAKNGGAIYNTGGTTGTPVSISDSTFSNNSAEEGGAITGCNIKIEHVTFDNNKATSGNGLGGAIWNLDALTISNNTRFINNKALYGGAIFNSQASTISKTAFESNTAEYNGGAICMGEDIDGGSISDSTFTNNTATNGKGGAIYIPNYTYVALSGTNTFTGNKDSTGNNDICNEYELNINGGTTTINGGISGTGNTYINGGTLAFGNGATFTDGYLHLNGGTLSLINGGIDTFNITNLNLDKNSSIAIDADLASQTAPFDKINVTNFSNSSNYTINISNIKVLSDFANPDTVSKTYPISDIIDGPNIANSVECNLSNVVGYSPIYKYDFNYDKTTGTITASRFGGGGGNDPEIYNPAILPSPVSSQVAGYTTMVESFNQGFNFVDNFMGMTKAERMAYRDRNKYALLDHTPQYTGSASKSLWVMPYTSFENVKLNNGPDIDAITYGTYFGGDSELYSLKHGWEAVYSLFAGYNGAYQTFGGVNMNYNGGSLGAAATFFKGNFFTAIDVAVGGGVTSANTMYGPEYSTMLSAGGAIKTGYNFEFKGGRHIIQPSLLLGYSFTNTFDYTNAAGIDITSDPLHAIILQPQIKYIMNLKNGWQPYAAVSMVFNIMDKAKFYAQDIALPEMSMKPYVQYGLGVQKKWGERCTGYVQAMVRNGGRNGVALSLGFKWQLGKGSSNSNL